MHFLYKKQKIYFQNAENMGQIKSNTIQLVFTSVPYWKMKDYHTKDQIGQEDEIMDYVKRLNNVWRECHRVTTKNAILAINIGSKRHKKKFYPLSMYFWQNMEKWRLIDKYIWFIPNALPQPKYYSDKLTDNKYEEILIFAKNYKYNYRFNKIRIAQKFLGKDHRPNKHKKGRSIGNVFKIPSYKPPTIKQMNYHEAAFPEGLANMLISTYSNKDDKILDPFVGSGTTLKVAYHLNRVGIGFEVNKKNKNLIKSRLDEKWNPLDFENFDIIFQESLNR